jgi:hypothetical protein
MAKPIRQTLFYRFTAFQNQTVTDFPCYETIALFQMQGLAQCRWNHNPALCS